MHIRSEFPMISPMPEISVWNPPVPDNLAQRHNLIKSADVTSYSYEQHDVYLRLKCHIKRFDIYDMHKKISIMFAVKTIISVPLEHEHWAETWQASLPNNAHFFQDESLSEELIMLHNVINCTTIISIVELVP